MILKFLEYLAMAILILIDIIVNVITLGSPFMTISMRIAWCIYFPGVEPRYKWVKKFANFIDWLFWDLLKIEKDHIKISFEPEEDNGRTWWQLYKIVDQVAFDRAQQRILDYREGVCQRHELYQDK